MKDMLVGANRLHTILDLSQPTLSRLSSRPDWPAPIARRGRGGEKVWRVAELPVAIELRGRGRVEIRLPVVMTLRLDAHRPVAPASASTPDERADRQIDAAVGQLRAQANAERSARSGATAEDLLGNLSERGHAKFHASHEIVLAWRDWKDAHPDRHGGRAAFLSAYNAGAIPVREDVRVACPTISLSTLQRWLKGSRAAGLAAHVDGRTAKGRARSPIAKHPKLNAFVLRAMSEKPHTLATHLHSLVAHASVDHETGEVLFPVPSKRALSRYMAAWKRCNAQVHAADTHPDAWKSKYMASLGKADGDILRLNQRWEMDATPADWMLRDGRHSCSVVIDVFSRRIRIRFSKTPAAQTHKLLSRAALLDWGVPEEIVTDNGQDYLARELLMAFELLGIAHRKTDPFSPWQKPFVESVIKTYLHSILELLDNFIGHDVAQRQRIRDQKSFSEQLFTKGAVVAVDVTADEMQALTDQWIAGVYHQRSHSSLGCSPFERAAAYRLPLRRIENERALDLLLAKPAKRAPIISARGIRYDNADFIHPDLPLHAGEPAEIALEPNDLGRLIVYVGGKFVCVAECAERTGVDRAAIAAHGRARQQQWIREEKAKLRALRQAGPSTDELVRDYLATQAQEAGKLVALPAPAKAHDSPGLQEAARAAAALDAAGRAPAPQFTEAQREGIAELEREAAANGGVLRAQTQVISMEDPHRVYARWLRLELRLQQGDHTVTPQERLWFNSYRGCAEWRATKQIWDDFGPQAELAEN